MANDSSHYDAVIADLEAKRDQLTAMIESLHAMKAVAANLPVSVPIPGMRHAGSATIPPDAFFGMTIPEATRKYLTIVKTAKPHGELCDALIAGGFKTNAANFRDSVRATLSRDPDFVRVSGQWGLSEWYGNRGKRKAKRSSTASDDNATGNDNADSTGEAGSDSGA